MRDADYQIRKARERGESIGLFAERLLSGTYPWAKLRQAQKLLRLADKYGYPRVDDACRRALRFDVINVHRVERIVKLALEKDAEDKAAPTTATEGRVVQMPLRFLREPGARDKPDNPRRYDVGRLSHVDRVSARKELP